MLSGNYCKTLCPVCEENFTLQDFKQHMEGKHKQFCELAKVNDSTYSILYQATSLRNVVNFVYYNWDYHIQTKYKITPEDRKNYIGVRVVLENENTLLTPLNILKKMINLNPIYAIGRLGMNIVRILVVDENYNY